MEAFEETHEVQRTNGAHQRQANGCIDRVTSADPVPEPKHVFSINAEFRDLFGVGRYRNKVLGDGRLITIELLQHPTTSSVGVRQSFLRGKSLGSNDEKSGAGIESIQSLCQIGWVHIGDKLGGDSRDFIAAQCLGCHRRPQIRTTDADVDHLLDGMAGMPQPLARTQCSCEITHATEDFVNIRCDILLIDHQVIFDR